MRPIPVLAILALLSACAPGDVLLGPEEIAARGKHFEVRQTVTRRVFEVEQGRAFVAHCLEDWWFREGRADVVNVTGSRFGPRDFLVEARAVDGSTGIEARVRPVGAVVPDPGVDRGTYVTVEFRLTCTDPAAR